jgi:hypothetical protein
MRRAGSRALVRLTRLWLFGHMRLVLISYANARAIGLRRGSFFA